jgi:prolipoprotein diacylglyceryltransferase
MLPGNLAAVLAPTWFTCVGLAGLVTLFLMLAIARRHRIDPGVVASIVLWCYVAAVAAGIVVPMTIDAAEQLFTTGRIQLRWAGMTSFWGYLAGLGAVAAVCRAHDVPLARLGDLASAPLGVALLFARLGCFLAGCDYGKVTSVAWAVRFPAGSPAWHDHVAAGLVSADRAESLPVHPTELYEAALGVVIAVVVLCVARLRWSRRGDGRVFLVAAAVYAVGRILIEALRGDAGRGIYLGCSSGQIFSILVLAAIACGCLPRRTRAATAIAAAALAFALAHPHPAAAQPAQPARRPPPPPAPGTPAPQPDRPFGPAPPPAGYQPGQPGQPTPAQPAPAQPAPAQPAPLDAAARPAPANAVADSSSRSTIQIGGLVGIAMPINRRTDQVATLAGPSISLGLARHRFGVWLDLDSFGNRDASHGTVLLSGSMMIPVANKIQIGGRLGIGATLVNFDDPAFHDVAGTAVRVDALVEYALGDSWAVWLRPLSFDVLSAAALGGPITTWQTRLGVGYHFAVGRRASPAPTSPSPSAPYQPAAGPYQPAPAPGPYQPAPAPGPYQPAPAPGPYQPAPAPGPYQPTPAPGPYQPAPAPGPYQPAPQRPLVPYQSSPVPYPAPAPKTAPVPSPAPAPNPGRAPAPPNQPPAASPAPPPTPRSR